MTKLLEIAVEAARQLAPEEQDVLARTILEIVRGTDEEAYVLSDAQRAAIEVARQQVARGAFATEEEIDEIFKKYTS